MTSAGQWPFLAVFSSYLASLFLYFADFESQRDHFYRAARFAAGFGLALHAIFLLFFFTTGDAFASPILTEATASFLVILVSFWLERAYRARFLMLFSLPVALFLCMIGIVHVKPALAGNEPRGWWLWLHSGLMLSGFAGLVAAVSSAAMYLLQSAQLKSKHLGRVFLELPSLDTLDKIHFLSLSWGVILFSLGILSGVVWASDLNALGELFHDPKVLMSLAACLFYGVILSFRLSALRRGQKIAASTVLLFALLLGTLFTSYVAPSTFHRGF